MMVTNAACTLVLALLACSAAPLLAARNLQQLGVSVNLDLGALLGISLDVSATFGVTPVVGGNAGALNNLVSLPALDLSSLYLPALPVRQSGNGISYRGGNILTSPSVYYIYYGNWDPSSVGPDAKDILENFASNVASSPLFRIATGYWDQTNFVQPVLNFGGSYSDSGSKGLKLTTKQMTQLVAEAIHFGGLPLDFNGIYAILPSPDVDTDYNGSFFSCGNYCAFHSTFGKPGRQIKFTFVGNPATHCFNQCTASPTGSNTPNGNPGVDVMVSNLLHEIVESITDPLQSTWYDDSRQEIGDKCVYNYVLNPSLATVPSGAAFNMIIGSRPYLIQGLWVNSLGGSCNIVAPY